MQFMVYKAGFHMRSSASIPLKEAAA
jgi:hypothetical protein